MSILEDAYQRVRAAIRAGDAAITLDRAEANELAEHIRILRSEVNHLSNGSRTDFWMDPANPPPEGVDVATIVEVSEADEPGVTVPVETVEEQQ
jgi:hypothetical protein